MNGFEFRSHPDKQIVNYTCTHLSYLNQAEQLKEFLTMATTVEINDAYFCSHIKEVVSCLRFLQRSELDYHTSAKIAVTMGEKIMTHSMV